MKVAVLSVVPTCGKSVLIELLAGVYTRSQGKLAAVFSTGDAQDNIELIESEASDDLTLDSPYVVRAALEGGIDQKDKFSILSYGTRAGDENVYVFDILGSKMAEEDKEEFFLTAIERIPVELTLIEICGDPKSEFNTKVLSACDCSIVLIDQSKKGLRKLLTYFDGMDIPAVRDNHAICVSRFDPDVSSDKKLATLTGLPQKSIYKLYELPIIKKYALDGNLDRIVYNIVHGDAIGIQQRQPIMDLMKFIYDTDDRKIIREYDRWFK